LQFSLALSLPPSFPSDKIVFVQYLFALAVCQGLDDDERIGVRLKWPNDIYAEVEDDNEGGGKTKIKIGGILVTTSFLRGEWKIIVGCGINILNSEPTTSLSKLHQLATEKFQRLGKDVKALGEAPTMEGSLAKILVAFEPLWERFLEDKGFEPFLDEYTGRWMHT
jgi:biotin---protein ligase